MALVVQSNQTERLNQIFGGLKSRNPDVRAQSSEELKRFVSALSICMSEN